MSGSNCWDVMKCGREHDSPTVNDQGECAASAAVKANGLHGGLNGGRVCWAIAGSFSGKQPSCTFVARMGGCESCTFYKMVRVMESSDYKQVNDILNICNK